MEYTAELLLLTGFFCLFSAPSSGLKCWQNSNSTAAAEWSIKECNISKNETACIAQYRLYNGQPLPSFFGCHTPKTRCNYTCESDYGYSCCCSSGLCNSFPPRPQPHLNCPPLLPSNPSALCQAKGCGHNCIEHKGRAECYCNGGYTLAADGTTCIDINECEHNNGGCELNCQNEIGGYHCSCLSNQILRDGYRCENYTGLICASQSCNNTGCAPTTVSYCSQSSTQYCQAVYKRDKVGGFEVRLLSCFSGMADCQRGSCNLGRIGSINHQDIYYCCCNENYCNNNPQLPT